MKKVFFSLSILLITIGCSLSINPTLNGTDFGYIDISSNAGSWNKDVYELRQNGEYGVSFDYGIVKGLARCNAHQGTYDVVKEYNTDSSNWLAKESQLSAAKAESRSCWCAVTEFTGKAQDVHDISNASYVYIGTKKSSEDCNTFCAFACAKELQTNYDYRKAIFSTIN
jgi:hypothetical protein